MLNPKTLRGRLSLAYASALVLALVAFAFVTLAVVDGAQRRAVDHQLEATADALRVVGDVRHGTIALDAGDRVQFDTIVGDDASSAILASNGSIPVTTDIRMARELAPQFGAGVVPVYATVTASGENVRVFAEPILLKGQRVGETLTWRSTGLIGALDRAVAGAFGLAIPLIVAVAVLAGGAIARRGLLPLDRIATLASEIEAHDLSRRLALPERGDELGRLAGTFDRMLDRLQNAFERERRFTSDASHELRAPLSVIRAEADLALRSQRTPAEYQRALETIASESDALEALTRDLLAAARNGSDVEDVRAPVNLAHVASAVAGRMSVVARPRRVFARDIETGDATVAGNRALIERAVVSVVHNALKYGSDSGSVEIDVASDEREAHLTVRDDGPGFTATGLQRAFDRFWRDDEARSRDGSGLGLSLAKTIVERYGGTIALANAEPHGAVVSMTFPLVEVR